MADDKERRKLSPEEQPSKRPRAAEEDRTGDNEQPGPSQQPSTSTAGQTREEASGPPAGPSTPAAMPGTPLRTVGGKRGSTASTPGSQKGKTSVLSMCCRAAQDISPVHGKVASPRPSTSGLTSSASKVTRRGFSMHLRSAEPRSQSVPAAPPAPVASPRPLRSALRHRPAVEPDIVPAREVHWVGVKDEVEEEKKEPSKAHKVRRTKGRLRKHYFFGTKNKRKKVRCKSSKRDLERPPQMRDRGTCTTEVEVAVHFNPIPPPSPDLPKLPEPPKEDPESSEDTSEEDEPDSEEKSGTDDEPEPPRQQAQLA